MHGETRAILEFRRIRSIQGFPVARLPRLHVPGGFYHVTLRGNHRQPIFYREEDHGLLDTVFAETVQKHGATVHAYCWMTNHLHALIQVSTIPLGRVMRDTASRFARTVQLRFSTTGHFFERRYHAVLVDANRRLLAVVRYIHLNPVRAGMVSDISLYPWSSHDIYLGRRTCPWVTTDFTMNLLSRDPSHALANYINLMNSTKPCRWGHGMLTPNRRQPGILGDDQFVARVTAQRDNGGLTPSLRGLVLECSKRFGIEARRLTAAGNGRRYARARAWIAHEALARSTASVATVGRHLGRSESAIRALMQRHPPDAGELEHVKVRTGTT